MSGSAPLRTDELLAHAGGIRRLALGIVADSSTADDVVQETLVAAVERPPRAGVPLAPWLARVARNVAWKLRRGDARRGRRESLSARPDAVPADESLARAEAYRLVVDAVAALDAPYRDVVLMRYFDGIETSDIAARLGVPVETVRTRLKRAHAMLRSRLGDDRDGGAWLVALAPVLRGPRLDAPPPVDVVPRTATLLGGILMAKKAAAIAIALLLLAGGAWLAATARRAPREAIVAAADSAQSVGTAPTGARRAKPESAPLDVPVASPLPPTATNKSSTAWRLRGRCDGLDVGAVAPSITVRPIEESSDEESAARSRSGRADSAGTVDVDVSAFFANGVAISELAVDVDAPDFLPIALRVPVARQRKDGDGATTFPLHVVLVRAVLLAGSVVDEHGAPFVGAQVGAFAMDAQEPARLPVDRATTGADGAFRLRLPNRGRYAVVAIAARTLPESAVTTGGAAELKPLTLRPGARVAGRVVLGTGDSAHGTAVEARPKGPAGDLSSCMSLNDRQFAWIDGRAVLCPATAAADDDGRFVLAGLESALQYRVGIERLQDPWIMQDAMEACGRDVRPPAEHVDIAVVAARMRIEVRGGGKDIGKPALMITSTAPAGGGTTTALGLDAAGRRTVLLAPGATCHVILDAKGFDAWEHDVTAPAAGEELALTADLVPSKPRNVVVLTLKTPDGASIDRAAVKFLRHLALETSFAWGRTVRAENGAFRVEGIEPGRYRVVVRPGGPWLGGDATWMECETEVEVPQDGDVAATIEVRRGARLRVAARDAEGRLLQARCVVRDAVGNAVPVMFVARFGAGNLTGDAHGLHGGVPCGVDPALPAGPYRVEFSLDGYRARTADAELRVGETVDVDATLERE
jgi:RNA polymerase sigma-70 factor (ECF subfamily)